MTRRVGFTDDLEDEEVIFHRRRISTFDQPFQYSSSRPGRRNNHNDNDKTSVPPELLRETPEDEDLDRTREVPAERVLHGRAPPAGYSTSSCTSTTSKTRTSANNLNHSSSGGFRGFSSRHSGAPPGLNLNGSFFNFNPAARFSGTGADFSAGVLGGPPRVPTAPPTPADDLDVTQDVPEHRRLGGSFDAGPAKTGASTVGMGGRSRKPHYATESGPLEDDDNHHGVEDLNITRPSRRHIGLNKQVHFSGQSTVISGEPDSYTKPFVAPAGATGKKPSRMPQSVPPFYPPTSAPPDPDFGAPVVDLPAGAYDHGTRPHPPSVDQEREATFCEEDEQEAPSPNHPSGQDQKHQVPPWGMPPRRPTVIRRRGSSASACSLYMEWLSPNRDVRPQTERIVFHKGKVTETFGKVTENAPPAPLFSGAGGEDEGAAAPPSRGERTQHAAAAGAAAHEEATTINNMGPTRLFSPGEGAAASVVMSCHSVTDGGDDVSSLGRPPSSIGLPPNAGKMTPAGSSVADFVGSLMKPLFGSTQSEKPLLGDVFVMKDEGLSLGAKYVQAVGAGGTKNANGSGSTSPTAQGGADTIHARNGNEAPSSLRAEQWIGCSFEQAARKLRTGSTREAVYPLFVGGIGSGHILAALGILPSADQKPAHPCYFHASQAKSDIDRHGQGKITLIMTSHPELASRTMYCDGYTGPLDDLRVSIAQSYYGMMSEKFDFVVLREMPRLLDAKKPVNGGPPAASPTSPTEAGTNTGPVEMDLSEYVLQRCLRTRTGRALRLEEEEELRRVVFGLPAFVAAGKVLRPSQYAKRLPRVDMVGPGDLLAKSSFCAAKTSSTAVVLRGAAPSSASVSVSVSKDSLVKIPGSAHDDADEGNLQSFPGGEHEDENESESYENCHTTAGDDDHIILADDHVHGQKNHGSCIKSCVEEAENSCSSAALYHDALAPEEGTGSGTGKTNTVVLEHEQEDQDRHDAVSALSDFPSNLDSFSIYLAESVAGTVVTVGGARAMNVAEAARESRNNSYRSHSKSISSGEEQQQAGSSRSSGGQRQLASSTKERAGSKESSGASSSSGSALYSDPQSRPFARKLDSAPSIQKIQKIGNADATTTAYCQAAAAKRYSLSASPPPAPENLGSLAINAPPPQSHPTLLEKNPGSLPPSTTTTPYQKALFSKKKKLLLVSSRSERIFPVNFKDARTGSKTSTADHSSSGQLPQSADGLCGTQPDPRLNPAVQPADCGVIYPPSEQALLRGATSAFTTAQLPVADNVDSDRDSCKMKETRKSTSKKMARRSHQKKESAAGADHGDTGYFGNCNSGSSSSSSFFSRAEASSSVNPGVDRDEDAIPSDHSVSAVAERKGTQRKKSKSKKRGKNSKSASAAAALDEVGEDGGDPRKKTKTTTPTKKQKKSRSSRAARQTKQDQEYHDHEDLNKTKVLGTPVDPRQAIHPAVDRESESNKTPKTDAPASVSPNKKKSRLSRLIASISPRKKKLQNHVSDCSTALPGGGKIAAVGSVNNPSAAESSSGGGSRSQQEVPDSRSCSKSGSTDGNTQEDSARVSSTGPSPTSPYQTTHGTGAAFAEKPAILIKENTSWWDDTIAAADQLQGTPVFHPPADVERAEYASHREAHIKDAQKGKGQECSVM